MHSWSPEDQTWKEHCYSLVAFLAATLAFRSKYCCEAHRQAADVAAGSLFYGRELATFDECGSTERCIVCKKKNIGHVLHLERFPLSYYYMGLSNCVLLAWR